MMEDYTKFGAAVADLRNAYPDRLAEANLLLNSGHTGSAVAFGLFAVEIYLKVRICERLDLAELPKAFHIHALDGLLVLSGLKTRMDSLSTQPVKANWEYLASPTMRLLHIGELRYKPNNTWSHVYADDVLKKIQDPTVRSPPMAVGTSLKHALRRFLVALAEYADEEGWKAEDYQIYYLIDSNWDKIYILFVANGFANRGEFENYASVREYLLKKLADEPELIRYLSLVVRSRKQLEEAGISEIGKGYREYRPSARR